MRSDQFSVGKKVLVTTDSWFLAPDGRQYKAAWGTVQAIETDEKTLGVRTNARSTNWYLQVGEMVIAGCQIHYAVACEKCDTGSVVDWKEVDGQAVKYIRPSFIYNADGGLDGTQKL